MERRKESLSVLKLCRFCLSQDNTLTTLYDRKRAPKNEVSLPLKILSCVSIEVFPSDKMPSYICHRCKFFMDVTYEFKQICRQADENILQYILKGSGLETINWPSILTEICPSTTENNASEVGVWKTADGGTTVKVTTHDASDSEADDEENVYDIKIGDESDEGSKGTSIKLIASTDDCKNKQKRNREDGQDSVPSQHVSYGADSEELDMATTGQAHRSNDLTDGCWPCDECHCTYPLQQLLELHKIQKHRERTVKCDQCDAKFFSKYDLSIHEVQHSDEMKFQCIACDKPFKRFIHLKRHEKMSHADLIHHQCEHCPATFLSLDELHAHQEKHIRSAARSYVCMLCDKKFDDKDALQNHKDVFHAKKPILCCEYCPEQFSTVAKLKRHVRSHAGERAYPCKYCDKTFLKSHHYTRHLRGKHSELTHTVATREQSNEQGEQYRCEQCDDTFASQDGLIYHSAIHATQNLICPLCQERFEDVEAVTSHIKSHVTGTEFMCDLCELVFTSKEKLDNHITTAHDDEMNNIEQEMEQDDSSYRMDVEDDDDGNAINVKEENDHMVVEIKKAHEFMLPNYKEDSEEKNDNTNSEESEAETTYTELSTVNTLAITKDATVTPIEKTSGKTIPVIINKQTPVVIKPIEKGDNQTASILRKAEDMKRKASQQQATERSITPDKKNNVKNEPSTSTGANDKSLRLLEKDLQELKRTNMRSSESNKTPAKNPETLRNKKLQIHTSTPKLARASEEKKTHVLVKAAAVEKKQMERRAATKEIKEHKEQKNNNTSSKEDKEKEKEIPKANGKNGTNEKNGTEEIVRRSTRPSKIKDYAKMVNDRSQDSEEDSDSDYSEESEEEADKSIEIRPKGRRVSLKQAAAKPAPAAAPAPAPPTPAPAPAVTPTPTPTPGPTPRKRGRPRKNAPAVPAAKIMKEDSVKEETKAGKAKQEDSLKPKDNIETAEKTEDKPAAPETSAPDTPKPAIEKISSDILVSPTGQTLKKVPMKSLPPGVRPLPLPPNARPLTTGEVCEMQIGKKVVKVQKIVMTKAEVEAMAKKGLVEMKDGTMVLKQGIKLPTADPAAIKSSLIGEIDANKESPVKKAAPTRCEVDDA